jgi:hypothetical protein
MNEIRFVSTNLAEEDNSDDPLMPLAEEESASRSDGVSDTDGTVDDFLDYEFLEFQLMPREDLVAALRAGLFGTDVCGLPAGAACCGGGAAGGAGGGGGGGAGGGGIGGGLGGALLGAGIAGAVGGAGGSSSSSAASPFEP